MYHKNEDETTDFKLVVIQESVFSAEKYFKIKKK